MTEHAERWLRYWQSIDPARLTPEERERRDLEIAAMEGLIAARRKEPGRELSVNHCARCGEDHAGVVFQRFKRPIEDSDGTVWAWWGMCPATDEPVLMRDIETEGN